MGKLADLIHGASKSREAAEMNEIVSGGEAPRRGAFGRVCQEADGTRLTRLLEAARVELTDNLKMVDDEGTLNNFRNRYKGQGVLSAAIEDLIDKARNVVHPPRNHADAPEGDLMQMISAGLDAPEAEPSEIARRTRA